MAHAEREKETKVVENHQGEATMKRGKAPQTESAVIRDAVMRLRASRLVPQPRGTSSVASASWDSTERMVPTISS